MVAGAGLSVVSLLAPLPVPSTPPVGVETQSAEIEPVAVEVESPTLAVDAATGIQIEAPDMSPGVAMEITEPTPPIADTTPADRPDPIEIAGDMAVPEAEQSAGVEATTDAPVLQSPMVAQPEMPSGEADIVVSTQPAIEVIVVPEEEPAPVEDAPVVTDVAPEMVVPDVVVPEVVAPEPEPTPEPEAPIVNAAPVPGRSGEPASVMPSSDSAVVIRRPTTETEAPVVEVSTNALLDYSAYFANPDDLPLMSFVVIDDGALPNGPLLLSAVPFPVTVAIAVSDPDAASKSAAYRAVGYEVAAILTLPANATAPDAAQVMEATFATMPEAAMVLDMGDAGLQSNRQATEAVMARLAADGRGFITAASGLNAAIRAAEGADVPVATVERDLDSNDQTAAVIRRFIDRSAFQARQTSGVVLISRLRAETLSALTLWSTANRAGQVALAPVSAILKD
ncbi:hypothetical protein B9057_05875 [Aestuarium zhoushanense]|nr:hypothetical protein B9057_05875 [Aestuarium zhoushanense]